MTIFLLSFFVLISFELIFAQPHVLRQVPPPSYYDSRIELVSFGQGKALSNYGDDNPGSRWFETNATLSNNWKSVELPVGYDTKNHQVLKTELPSTTTFDTQHRIKFNVSRSQLILAKRFGFFVRFAVDNDIEDLNNVWLNNVKFPNRTEIAADGRNHESVSICFVVLFCLFF